ncbi:hypothetical protein SAMN04487948_103260 [Halogranum amylolyticum]|uniref:Uncharacterized protein n=1 Tax=Halogranum amylolyticum TaxID=660520 RepID=A0A1H8QQX2_9EURY|nr:hypothetical protein [Halogranum amylolyticum]SEO56600.1 hypothetical protein SAMN04487948_103260 [Halogranum amylolyticum]
MTDYSLHEPEFSGTTDGGWDEPQLEDFDTDDLSAVDDHFLLSADGFPPENFTDLKLPVVDPDGNLNRHALQTAKSGGHGVGAIDDVDDDTKEDVKELIDRLANEHFEDAEFGD